MPWVGPDARGDRTGDITGCSGQSQGKYVVGGCRAEGKEGTGRVVDHTGIGDVECRVRVCEARRSRGYRVKKAHGIRGCGVEGLGV